MKIKRFTVDICQACLNLEGEMCDTVGCSNWLLKTTEIKELLSRLFIRYEDTTGVYFADHILEFDNEEDAS